MKVIEKWALPIILAFTFFYRIYLLTKTSLTFYSDDAIYAELARFVVQGEWQKVFHPTWSPLFPLLSAFVFPLFSSWELSLRFISVAASTLLLIPLYLLIKNTLTRLHALLVVLAISFLTPVLELSAFPLSDMLATFLLTSGLVSIYLAIQKKNQRLYLLGSFFFGLTYLSRSEGTVYFLLSLVFLIVYFLIKRPFPAKMLLLFTAVFFLTASPYLVATKNQLGRWTLSHKVSAQFKQGHAFQIRDEAGTAWIQEVVSVKSPNYQSGYFSGGYSYVLDNFDWFWSWFLEKLGKWWFVFLENFHPLTIPLILLGFSNIFRKGCFWSLGYLTGTVLTVILITAFATPISLTRYLLWVIPFLFFFASLGINQLVKNPGVSLTLTFIFILIQPSFNLEQIIDPKLFINTFNDKYQREEIDQASSWIKDNYSSTNPRVMMRHEGVEFYADGETIYTPQELEVNETVVYAERFGTDYLIAWSEELASDPKLKILLDGDFSHPKLEKKIEIQENGRLLIIYLLKPSS